MKVFGWIVGLAIIFGLAPVLRGYVLHELWAWFLVPLGLPIIGKAHAYGIAILLWLATTAGTKSQLDQEKPAGEQLIQACVLVLMYPAVSLLAGWIVKGWM